MKKYIAFLRGINISGKNKISMSELKSYFEEIGFLNVITYLNSGNVIFSSNNENKSELKRKIESMITEKFSLNIPVEIISENDLGDILRNTPEWWGNDNREIIDYAIFVITPASVEEVFIKVGEINPEYEKITHFANVIFWTTPLKTFNKANWSKIASSGANNNVTIRSANTIKRLLNLIKS